MVAADLTFLDTLVRLGLAALLGGLLGLEREANGQRAGLRTHMLLALGAGLFGVVSVGGFDDFMTVRQDTNVQVDVTRIASYVAAGVGFLGAGTIIKTRAGARGLTTAASIWTTAAIGLAAGVGFWEAAVAATVIALVALVAFQPFSHLIARLERPRRRLLERVVEGEEDGSGEEPRA